MIAYEILELYCELLSVRVELMKLNKSLPEDMQESVASVIYAAQRCSAQLPELAVVKAQLQAKYGKEYVQRAQSDETCLSEQVNPRLIESLAIKVPSPKKKSVCRKPRVSLKALPAALHTDAVAAVSFPPSFSAWVLVDDPPCAIELMVLSYVAGGADSLRCRHHEITEPVRRRLLPRTRGPFPVLNVSQ